MTAGVGLHRCFPRRVMADVLRHAEPLAAVRDRHAIVAAAILRRAEAPAARHVTSAADLPIGALAKPSGRNRLGQ